MGSIEIKITPGERELFHTVREKIASLRGSPLCGSDPGHFWVRVVYHSIGSKLEEHMKPYSLDLRRKIVSVYEAGNISIRQVAERFKVSKNTVLALLKLKREKGTLSPLPATGGKPSQLAEYAQEVESMVAEHPDYTLEEYCEYWQEKTGVRLSESAMCRFLQKQKLTRKKKP